MNFFKKRIYLDYAAATPVCSEALRVMRTFLKKDFYNPSSIYSEGRLAKRRLEESRAIFAQSLGTKRGEIIFTSGGTESNNLAVLGVLKAVLYPKFGVQKYLRPHIVLSEAGHSSLKELEREIINLGGEVSIAQRDEKGFISSASIEKVLKPNTILVSLPFADANDGSLVQLSKISRLIKDERKKRGNGHPYLHIDGSQAALYFDLNLEKRGIDILSLDSSKIYGPKGAGLVAFKSIEIQPIILGGGQEGGLRAGTENLPAIAGFSKAWQVQSQRREEVEIKVRELREYFIKELEKNSRIEISGRDNDSLPHIITVLLPKKLLAEYVVLALEERGVLASAGSACLSQGGNPEENSIRFSLGENTRKNDLCYTARVFNEILKSANIES